MYYFVWGRPLMTSLVFRGILTPPPPLSYHVMISKTPLYNDVIFKNPPPFYEVKITGNYIGFFLK